MKYEKEKIKSWNVYTIDGELSITQLDDYEMLSDDVNKDIKNGEYKFFFDLTNVPYVDSSGISILILVISRASKFGVTVKVCGLNDITKKVFHMIKTHHVFELFESRQAAMESLS